MTVIYSLLWRERVNLLTGLLFFEEFGDDFGGYLTCAPDIVGP
jgi:hypothetical protein